MLEVGRRVRIGEDPRELLELEGPLAGGGVLVAAGEDEQPVGGGLVGGHARTSGSRSRATAMASGIASRAAVSAGSPVRAADRAAIARSSVVYVLVAATASSGPAPEVDGRLGGRRQGRGRVVGDGQGRCALAAAFVDHGDDVRRRAGLADADDERPIEPRPGAVQRDDRRRAEPDRQVVPDTQHVLRVDRRVVARAAGRDDDVIDAAPAEGLGERPDDLGGAAQEPGGDLGLFEDLVAEGHEPMCRPGGAPVSLGSRRAFRPVRHPKMLMADIACSWTRNRSIRGPNRLQVTMLPSLVRRSATTVSR